MDPLFAGIDLGGTAIKAAVFSSDGTRIADATAPTNDGESLNGRPLWQLRVRDLLAQLESQTRTLSAVGISAPGLAAPDERSIHSMPGRMSGLEGFDWSSWLLRPSLVPVLNDAHAALLGEVWCGAAKGARDAVMFTLGTGVGGAIWSQGRLLRGHLGRAGHFGHLCLDLDGPPTIASMPGGLELFAGNHNIASRSAGRWQSTRDLVAAVSSGNPDAIAVWERSLHALACGIASVINVVDPERVVIGGGIAVAGPVLFDPLAKAIAQVEWRPTGRAVPLVPAALGEWAGAAGAAWHASQFSAPAFP
jgi:glucokinase